MNFAWMSIEPTQPGIKPYITSATWNVERSICRYAKVRKSNRWSHLGDFIGHAAPPDGISISVYPGELHICGVDVSGSIECWGDNSFQQSAPPEGTFNSVSAGASHTCGLKTDGSIECRGSNEDFEGNLAGQATPRMECSSSLAQETSILAECESTNLSPAGAVTGTTCTTSSDKPIRQSAYTHQSARGIYTPVG